jgi:hypothetical protein
MNERDPLSLTLRILAGAGFFLWLGLHIMICDTGTRQVDWLGVGGRTGWKLSCGLEMAAIALAVVLLLFLLERLAKPVVLDRKVEKRIYGSMMIVAVVVLYFLVPAGGCILKDWPAPEFIGGPFRRELGCMLLAGVMASVVAVVFAVMYWWEYRK